MVVLSRGGVAGSAYKVGDGDDDDDDDGDDSDWKFDDFAPAMTIMCMLPLGWNWLDHFGQEFVLPAPKSG